MNPQTTLTEFKELFGTYKSKLGQNLEPLEELIGLTQIVQSMVNDPSMREGYDEETTKFFEDEFMYGFLSRMLNLKKIKDENVRLFNSSNVVCETDQGDYEDSQRVLEV